MDLIANSSMTSSKPYLIRAIYEWLLDNSLTPFIAVDTSYSNVMVPSQYIKDNQIILNLEPTAAHNLQIGNDAIECEARFSGKISKLFIPIGAVIAIYAHENNRGMSFPPEDYSQKSQLRSEHTSQGEKASLSKTEKNKPKLTLVTGEKKD